MDKKQAAIFGTYVRDQRRAAGLTQYEVAARVGVNQAQIVRLERGEVANPKPELLGRLASALGLPAADLMRRANYPVHRDIPSLPVYMRAKYDLPPDAAQKVEAFIQELRDQYRNDGPSAGEDEQ